MPNAIITGATQGIGKALAEKLLSEGFDIAVCARTQADLDRCRQQWMAIYPERTILAIAADMSNKQQVLLFAEKVLARFKEVEILVNNAGLFFPGLITTEPDGQLEYLMQLNLYSAYYLTRSVLPSFSRSGKGHIFNICSVASHKAYPNGGAYGISKYAMLGFSENLRLELMPMNIRVTSISPGATNSRSWEGAGIDPERMMEPEDVSDIIWSAYSLSAKANVETIIIRPIKGDL